MRTIRLAVIALTGLACALQASPAQAATAVAVWHMNDTGSVMTDSSGNGLNGTLKNVTTGQPGTSGTAFGFLGKPSYVTVKSSSKLNPGTATFTVSAQVKFSVKPSTAIGDYDLIRKGLTSTAGGDWKMEILPSGYAFCLFKGSAGQRSLSHGPNLANNAWHSITCSRTSTGIALTVDGRTWTKSGATGTISNSSSVLLGAKNSTGEDQFAGLMDEVTITTG